MDRFKPSKNKLMNLLSAGSRPSFSGQGQSLGGAKYGTVIPVQIDQPGPLGIQIEKQAHSETAIIARVVPQSQADQAGLKRGDILCFPGTQGSEEILYTQFLELAKSDQRPLCFEVRRVDTQTNGAENHGAASGSADAFARRQAVIAAAEARDKAHKAKSKPVSKKTSDGLPNLLSTAERQQIEKERQERLQKMSSEPMSEQSKAAREAAKQSEAELSNQLGYNPYETNRATAGQARNATTVSKHGTLSSAGPANATALQAPNPVSAPQEIVAAEIDPTFDAAFETLVTANDQASAFNSLSIMKKLIVNATTKGQGTTDDAAKFRKVRLGNPKIKAAIVDVEGAVDLMMSTGFQIAEQDGESVLQYTGTAPSWLPGAIEKIEAYEKRK